MRFQSLVGKDRSGSRLLPALTFSVILHSLVLWTAPPHVAQRAGQMPLAASLRAAAAAEPSSPSRQSPPSPSRKSASAPARPTTAAVSAEAVADVSVPAAGAAGGEQAASAGKGAAGVPDGEAAGLDAAGILAYRMDLAREMRNHRYPPLARERGWTGEAEVELDVSRQGRPRQVLLARSSGHDALDREALAMTTRAASAAALPPSLRGQAFTVRLSIEFKLTDSP